jgi:hypothetical protein
MIEMIKMNKLIFLAAIIPILLVPNVYAGGPRLDSPDGSTKEGANCWVDGYDAGFAGKYDKDRADGCLEKENDEYNYAWIYGCDDAGYLPSECDDFRNNPVQFASYRLPHENTIWCWSSGYWDGLTPAFDRDKDIGCREYGSLYDNGFMEGCIRAENNNQNRTSCDRLTKD